MSTRSFIGYVKDNKIIGVYCHWDGYVSNNGKILYQHYKDIKKIKKLIDLGYLSCLGTQLRKKKHTTDTVCVAMYRDHGDYKRIDTFSNLEDFLKHCKNCWIEYAYIFVDNKWYVITNFESVNNTIEVMELDHVLKTKDYSQKFATTLLA